MAPARGWKQFTHAGSSNFIVSQLDDSLQESEGLVNDIGGYKGTTILDHDDGSETSKLKIQADGKWTVAIKPLNQARTIEAMAVSGKGDDVLIYTGRVGVATLTHKGTSNFIVSYYNEDSGDGLVNEIGRHTGEAVISEGPGFLQIHADGTWTVKVTP